MRTTASPLCGCMARRWCGTAWRLIQGSSKKFCWEARQGRATIRQRLKASWPMHENSIDGREERTNERCGNGRRTNYRTWFEPGGAGGGYVHRPEEDVHGHPAEYELVAAVFADAGGDGRVDRCGGETGRLGPGVGEPDPPKSQGRREAGGSNARAKSRPGTSVGEYHPLCELLFLSLDPGVRGYLRADLLG